MRKRLVLLLACLVCTVSAARAETLDGIFFTISAPSGWKLTQKNDHAALLASPDGLTVFSITSAETGGRTIEELARALSEKWDGSAPQKLASSADDFEFTAAPDGISTYFQILAHGKNRFTVISVSGSHDSPEAEKIFDSILLK
jgi:hypothetical protein